TYQPMIVENPKKITEIDTIYSPTTPSVELNAILVRAPPSRFGSWVTPDRSPPEVSQEPVIISTSPVIVQTIIVTINVPVIATSACFTGCVVFALPEINATVPSPASLEKIPFETPC